MILIKHQSGWRPVASKNYIAPDVGKVYSRTVNTPAYTAPGQWYSGIFSVDTTFLPDGLYVVHVFTPNFSEGNGAGDMAIPSTITFSSMSIGYTNISALFTYHRDRKQNRGNNIHCNVYTGTNGSIAAGPWIFTFTKIR